MKRPRRWLLASCLLALPAMAAAKPNFSGNWSMNAAKSDYGPIPAPEKFTREIDHSEPNLIIKSHQVGQQGEIRSEFKYTTDGKESVNQLRGSEVRGTARWEGDVLVIESKRNIQGMDISQTDKWKMAEDGKSMKIESSIRTPQGDLELSVTFDKQ
jgi:hypothetical protein